MKKLFLIFCILFFCVNSYVYSADQTIECWNYASANDAKPLKITAITYPTISGIRWDAYNNGGGTNILDGNKGALYTIVTLKGEKVSNNALFAKQIYTRQVTVSGRTYVVNYFDVRYTTPHSVDDGFYFCAGAPDGTNLIPYGYSLDDNDVGGSGVDVL